MTEYIIAQAPSAVELQLLVEQLIERGWQLQGGVTVDNNPTFYQALVKTS